MQAFNMHWDINVKKIFLYHLYDFLKISREWSCLITQSTPPRPPSSPRHMRIILFQSFQFHDYFTIDLLSLGVYHYCIMTCCQHVHWFLLIDCLILIGKIFCMTWVLHLTVCRTQQCLYVVRNLQLF